MLSKQVKRYKYYRYRRPCKKTVKCHYISFQEMWVDGEKKEQHLTKGPFYQLFSMGKKHFYMATDCMGRETKDLQ